MRDLVLYLSLINKKFYIYFKQATKMIRKDNIVNIGIRAVISGLILLYPISPVAWAGLGGVEAPMVEGAQAHILSAMNAIDIEDWERAEQELEEAIRRAPYNEELYELWKDVQRISLYIEIQRNNQEAIMSAIRWLKMKKALLEAGMQYRGPGVSRASAGLGGLERFRKAGERIGAMKESLEGYDVEREETMRRALEEYSVRRERAMEDALSFYEEELKKRRKGPSERRGAAEKRVVPSKPKEKLKAYEEALEGYVPSTEKRETEAVSGGRGKGEIPSMVEKQGYGIVDVSGYNRSEVISIELEIDKFLILKFPGPVRQYVIVDEGLVSVERLSEDKLKLIPSGSGLGNTIVYVWDNGGRWMFSLKIIPSRLLERKKEQTRKRIEEKEHILFGYENNWWAFYDDTDGKMERKNLGFVQDFTLKGPTAYGNLSSIVSVADRAGNYDVVYRSARLRNIRRLGFKDGDVVVGDYFGNISRFTFPGSSLDGVMASERRGKFSIKGLYGQITNTWNYIPLIENETGDVYGLSVGYNGFYFNYAYLDENGARDGSSRFSNEAYSFYISRPLGKSWAVESEIGTDKDSWAGVLDLNGRLGKWDVSLNFRDVEADYLTLTGTPAYSGEIGSRLTLSRAFDRGLQITTYLDVYRDRKYPNPDKPHRLNIDYSFMWGRYLDNNSYGWEFDLIDHTGTVGPYSSYTLSGFYSRSFHFLDRDFYWRADLSHTLNKDKALDREYIVDRASSRLSASVVKDFLSAYVSSDVGRVEDKEEDKVRYPVRLEAGLNARVTSKDSRLEWTGHSSYRWETNGSGAYNFVSDRDLLYLSSKLEYRLSNDKYLYLQGGFRRYFPKDGSDYSEAEIYAGVKWYWDTGLNLLPKTFVYGYVYEDENGNGRMDKGESGIPNVGLSCGGKTARTNADGRYEIGWVKKASAYLELNVNDLPTGMLPKEDKVMVDTVAVKRLRKDFAVNYITGIKGYVFIDEDGDGRLGTSDIPLGDVRVCIGNECRYTDSRGMFLFSNLNPGDYTISLDLSSIPEDSLPFGKPEQKISLAKGVQRQVYLPLKKIGK